MATIRTALVLATLLALTSAAPAPIAPPHAAPAPATLPAPTDDLAPRLRTSNPRHVRALYFDLFGRPPRTRERLLAERLDAEQLVLVLTGSAEFWENWYEEELYYFLLLDNMRPAEGAPHTRLATRLTSGELSVTEGIRGLVSSLAFHRANPGPDTFVTVVFEQLLGLDVQRSRQALASGKRMYDGRPARLWGKTGDDQSDVVRIATEHEAFAPRYLARHYERIVGVPRGRSALADDVDRFRADPRVFPTLVAEWLLSEHYADRLQRLRPKSDRHYVRGLYVDLFGEPPTQEQLERTRAALAGMADAGPLRAVIARVLIDRRDPDLEQHDGLGPREVVSTCFVRFLGRLPTAQESAVLGAEYERVDADPGVLVLSLVTHPEYQHY